MSIISIIKTAAKAMNANKARTSLTILGMVIGIASIIIVFSAGAGIRGLIVGQVESFGTDIIETEIKVPSSSKGLKADQQSSTAIATGVQITTLTIKDAEDIDKLSNVSGGYAGVMGQEAVSYKNQLRRIFLYGVSSAFINIDKSKIAYGRFFSDSEDRSLAPVAVLGQEIKTKLFGDSNPIGKFIKIKKTKFRVIGVLAKRGAVMMMNFDNFIYLPVRTMQKRILGINHISFFINKLNNVKLAGETAAQARRIIRINHHISDPNKDDFRVVTMVDAMKVLNTVTDAITLLLLAIVAISLIVGGVGILNIMYVIVSERSSEIGLRKALGANYNDIMWQFLAESIFITILGAIIGIALGIAISALIAYGASASGLNWQFSIPLRAFITAIIFSLVTGILFGLFPARQAARLDPIEAMQVGE